MTIEKELRKKIVSSGVSEENGVKLSGRYGKVECIREKDSESIKTEVSIEENVVKNESKAFGKICEFMIITFLILVEYLFFKVFFIIVIIYFFIVFYGLIQTNLNDNLKKNHASEHLVIKYFWKYGRIPSIEELRNKKKIHYISHKCGSVLIMFMVYIFLIDIIFKFRIPIISVSLFIHAFGGYLNLLGTPIQFLITETPDDENLELAINSLNVLVDVSLKEINKQI